MKQLIPINGVYKILQKCPVVELEGRLLETQIYNFTGDPFNEFLSLSWTDVDEEDNEVHVIVTFTEGDNEVCMLDGSVLTLKSSEGKVTEELTLYAFFVHKNEKNSGFNVGKV